MAEPYIIGWTFKRFGAKESDYIKLLVYARSEKEALGIAARRIDNHMAIFTVLR